MISEQTKKTTNIYGDIACDICCCCPWHCCVSLVCSDRLFKRPFKSSHDFKPHFKRLVNTYRCDNNQTKEDELIISLYIFFKNNFCHPMTIHCCVLRLPLCNCGFKPQLLATNGTAKRPQTYF